MGRHNRSTISCYLQELSAVFTDYDQLNCIADLQCVYKTQWYWSSGSGTSSRLQVKPVVRHRYRTIVLCAAHPLRRERLIVMIAWYPNCIKYIYKTIKKRLSYLITAVYKMGCQRHPTTTEPYIQSVPR